MKPEPPKLATKRLVLRALQSQDADALFKVFSDEETCTWWTGPAHTQLNQTREYVARSVDDQNSQTWAITMADDIALGWIYLGGRKTGVAELGFILRRDLWGKGLVSEAASTVVEYGFETLKLHRIFADSDPDNIGSQKVIEKLGFQFEGIARANWNTHLGLRDSLIYGLVASNPLPIA